jgi:hypothetical protein
MTLFSCFVVPATTGMMAKLDFVQKLAEGISE